MSIRLVSRDNGIPFEQSEAYESIYHAKIALASIFERLKSRYSPLWKANGTGLSYIFEEVNELGTDAIHRMEIGIEIE